jgi:hypothetical protein
MEYGNSSFSTSLKIVLVIMGLVTVSVVAFLSARAGAYNGSVVAEVSSSSLTIQPTPTVLQTSTPWIFAANTPTSRFASGDKANYTPSTEEINAAATGVAERATAIAEYISYTPGPIPTIFYYPVKSIDDIPLAVLNNPDFQGDVNDPDFGPCAKAATPGKALFVKSLDKMLDDYYLVPFYKGNDVCGIAFVGVVDGKGALGAWSSAGGIPFPPVSAEEAKSLVIKARYKVVGEPVLSFQWLQEVSGEFFPFWAMTTADNQTIYVIYTRGIIEVWNSKDVHPIN